MNLLDVRTVLLGHFMSSTLCTAVMTALWLMNRRRYAGLNSLQAGFVLQFLASVLLAFRGIVPVYLSILLSCPLIVMGIFLFYRGLEDFTGKRGSQRNNYLLLAVLFGVHVYFLLVQSIMAARTIAFTVGVLVFCLKSAWLLLRRVDPEMRPNTRLAGWLFGALSLFSLVRIIVDLVIPPGSDLFTIGFYDALVIMSYQMLLIGLTFSFSLMVNRRLVGDLERDILERKRAEAEKDHLEAQNRHLVKAESLGRMAGAIAHHYNNLLSVIIGNLELAIYNLSGGIAVRDNLEEAMNAGRRASEVSGMMLTYLGHVSGELELIDLSAACREMLATLPCPLIARAELFMDLPSPGPIIKANRGQVQQALTNLLTNACEAIGEGHGAIRLNVKTVFKTEIPAKHRFPVNWKTKGDRYACVEVVDTGSGIAAKDFEKVFDPFYSSKFTGRGLGLPVALGIVRASHGVITVESKEGAGSAFRIFFPLSNEPVPRDLEKIREMTQADENGVIPQAMKTAQSITSGESRPVARF